MTIMPPPQGRINMLQKDFVSITALHTSRVELYF